MGDLSTNGERLESLRKREAALKALILKERLKQQARIEREERRLFGLVGQAVVRDTKEAPEFKAMIMRALKVAGMPDGDRAFLKRKGWL